MLFIIHILNQIIKVFLPFSRKYGIMNMIKDKDVENS